MFSIPLPIILSFYVTEEISDENEFQLINESEGELEKFINDKFYETLVNRIKSEITLALTEHNLLSMNSDENILLSTNDLVKQNLNCNKLRDNDALITALNDEITFLRKEILSKDKIIELVIKERSSNNYARYVNNTNDRVIIENGNNLNSKDSLLTSENFVKHNDQNGLINKSCENKCDENNGNIIDRSKEFKKVKSTKGNKKSITILGDSMLKDIKPFKMRNSLPNHKLFVKSFSGATVEEMGDYMKPSLKFDPDHIIIHSGTNDLKSNKDAAEIATDIIKLANNAKTDTNAVTISGIIPRHDGLNEKATKVNDFLKIKTNIYNLGFIENNNFITETHLNKKGLHLNYKGTCVLVKNLLHCINN